MFRIAPLHGGAARVLLTHENLGNVETEMVVIFGDDKSLSGNIMRDCIAFAA